MHKIAAWLRTMLRFITSLIAVLAVACSRPKPGAPPGTTSTRPVVTVSKVELGTITQTLDLTGDVRPWTTVVLTSKVPGRLERLAVLNKDGTLVPITEGITVCRDDVIAQIDQAVYEARLRQAEAAAAMADAQYHDTVREEKRMLSLFQEGVVTEQARDKAVTARMVAEAARNQALATLALAKIDFEESSLRSPLDGVVTRKHLDEGNLVSVGTPIVTIEQLSSVKIVFTVPERYLSSIVPGKTRVRVTSDALSEQIETVIAKVFPTVDQFSRTGLLEAHVENKHGQLRSGSFVRGALDVLTVQDTVIIPYSAITWYGQEAFVFVIRDGKAQFRSIRTGIRQGEKCQVLEGVRAGELLVVDGSRALRDGDEVAIREESTHESS